MPQNFDQVVVKDDQGGQRSLSWEEFWKLPLLDRINALTKGQLKFYLKGQTVDPVTAVRR
jgi:hypothetical protein